MQDQSIADVGARVIAPVVIWKTKSFLLGVVPAALALLDMAADTISSGAVGPVAAMIAAVVEPLFGVGSDKIEAIIQGLGLIGAFVVAYQRRGINQPYTISPTEEKTISQAVIDGKSAFEVGKEIGASLKKP